MEFIQRVYQRLKGSIYNPHQSKEVSGGFSKMSHLKEYLNYYMELTAPGYAVLVTGDWGTGKTYQVKNCVPEEDRLYVSLFGVQTVEQLHSEVFAAAAPTLAKAEKMVGKGSDIVAGMKGPWALAGAFPSVFNAVFKREIEPTKTLVFDDLERSDLELKDVLGAINSYVEHLGFRVVVIAHDERLAEEFLQMKEKTFGQSIRVEPQIEDALSHFLSDIGSTAAKKFASDFKDQIQDIFLRSQVKSLRILRHVVEDLVRLHCVLGEEHLKNEKAMNELITLFVAFQVEVRSGSLKESDLKNRSGASIKYLMGGMAKHEEKQTTPPIVEVDRKYPEVDMTSVMLNDAVLAAMLIDGRFPEEEIRSSIDNSSYFIIPGEDPPWKVVNHFDALDDSTVEEACARMEQQIENREVTVSGEILHIFCLRMMMAENGIIDRTVDEIVDECKSYLDDLLKSGRLPPRDTDWRWFDRFERSYDGFSYWISEANAERFRAIWDHLIACRETAFQKTLPAVCDDLLRLVTEDSKAFFEAVSSTNNGPNPYALIPLLQKVSPAKFVEAWLSADRNDWQTVSYALDNRYSSNQLERDLSAEKDWALEVLKELEQRAGKEAGFRSLRIKRIRPKVLVGLAHAAQAEALAEEA
jgi:hypothetical protein